MRPWVRQTVAIVLVGGVLALCGPTVEGQTTVTLAACKKLITSRLPGGGSDSITTRDCGTRFTADDPYVALVINVRFLRDTTELAVQLLDPADTSVFATRTQVNVPPGEVYQNYWLFIVLPLAADPRALAAESPDLVRAALRLPGRPAGERPGDWTFKLIARGTTYTLKFTIVGTPSAAPPPAAPVPTPAPSPSPAP